MSSYKQTEFDLQLSPGDSRVRTSQAKAAGQESSTGIDPLSGRRCFDCAAMYNRSGSLLKMFRCSAVKGCKWSSKISARSAMWENFTVFPLVPVAVLRTKGTGSGLLPTPDASPRGPRSPDLVINRSTVIRRGSGQKRGMDLETYVRMWPDWMDTSEKPSGERPRGQLNPEWVEQFLMGFPAGWTELDS